MNERTKMNQGAAGRVQTVRTAAAGNPRESATYLRDPLPLHPLRDPEMDVRIPAVEPPILLERIPMMDGTVHERWEDAAGRTTYRTVNP